MCVHDRVSSLKMIFFLLCTVFVVTASGQKLNCTNVDDCPDLMTECIANKCTCVENAELDPDTSDQCSCKDGYSNKRNMCVKDVEGPPIPMPCDLPRHCVSSLGVHSNCIKRNCFCTKGAKYNETGSAPTCFMMQYEINGSCESNTECHIISTHCKKNTCQCTMDFVATPLGTCIEDVKVLDGKCEFDIQCNETLLGQGAVCTNKKCVCGRGYRRVDNKCFRNANIGEDCDNDENCNHIANSQCSEETCSCEKGYITNPTATFCLEVAKSFKSVCEQNNQCSERLGDRAVCRNKQCECVDIYRYDRKSDQCQVISENDLSKSDSTDTLDSKVSISSSTDSKGSNSNGSGALYDIDLPFFTLIIIATKISTMSLAF